MAGQSLYSIIDAKTELKPYLGISEDQTEKDYVLHLLALHATAQVEAYLERLLVTRGAITEYHSLDYVTANLYVRQYPIISVTTVHEDTDRVYGATTLLVDGTDYQVNKPIGKLVRLWGATDSQRAWSVGFQAEKVVYTGGYATTAAVPVDIKVEAINYVANGWGEISRQQFGLSSVADDRGNLQRFYPGGLTPIMRKNLSRHKRFETSSSGEVLA